MIKNIIENKLIYEYDRFIVTRSDYFYWSPHPPLDILDPGYIWVPFGEDYGGITDRHLIVSPQDLQPSVDFLTELLRAPEEWDRELLRLRDWNLESFLYLQFSRRGLLSKIRRYPYVMATVRGPKDGSTWSLGNFDPDEGMIIKYASELKAARIFRDILTDKHAWRKFHAEGGFERLQEMTPQSSRRFEVRASSAKWRWRQILDRLGLI
jgi:hypothetical protein